MRGERLGTGIQAAYDPADPLGPERRQILLLREAAQVKVLHDLAEGLQAT